MPANTKPVEPFTAARHLDLQADLHFAFDGMLRGKRVLDVGAGLGKSKVRLRHHTVTTYEPSPTCRPYVDTDVLPAGPFDVVTAFEVIEHVKDDHAFARLLDGLATQAVFLTTPNWDVAQCQSAQHYREYTEAEWREFVRAIWPEAAVWWLAYYKDAEGGWVDGWQTVKRMPLKHVTLIDKDLPAADEARLDVLFPGCRA
jgi:2-polyprenyl-3-methyl-5-hydroxy-6-metoxy-1,4-benzoquinol methylase